MAPFRRSVPERIVRSRARSSWRSAAARASRRAFSKALSSTRAGR
jgi:hypothetical protein